MRKVKIICGIYGLHKGESVVSVNRDSDPIEVENAEADRIVALGIAKYVDTETPPKRTSTDNGISEQVQNLAKDAEEINGTSNESTEIEDEDEDDSETEVKPGTYSIDTSVSELRTIAKEVGISFKIGTTKEEMVTMLDDYFNSPENKPPNLTAMGPV